MAQHRESEHKRWPLTHLELASNNFNYNSFSQLARVCQPTKADADAGIRTYIYTQHTQHTTHSKRVASDRLLLMRESSSLGANWAEQSLRSANKFSAILSTKS